MFTLAGTEPTISNRKSNTLTTAPHNLEGLPSDIFSQIPYLDLRMKMEGREKARTERGWG